MQPVLNFPWIDIRTTLDDNPFTSADQMDIPFFRVNRRSMEKGMRNTKSVELLIERQVTGEI